MKLTKEVRIGLLVLIAFLVFFAGFYFLRGANLFSSQWRYVAYYESVEGLSLSAPVQVRGLAVGRVAAIELEGPRKGQVKLVLEVDEDLPLPSGTIAVLNSGDLLGSKFIELELGEGKDRIPEGATITTRKEGGFVDNISTEITPLIMDMRQVVTTLDTVLQGIHTMVDPTTRQRLQNSVRSLDLTMENLRLLTGTLEQESQTISRFLGHAESVAGNLEANNQRVTHILENLETTTDHLAAADLTATINTLNRALHEVELLMHGMNQEEGSLGLLIRDRQLYDNLTQTLFTLDRLLEDINRRPYRYINVTLFGKRNKE